MKGMADWTRVRRVLVTVALATGLTPALSLGTSVPLQDHTVTGGADWLPASAEWLPPSLDRTLRKSPHAFFRMANRAWASRVCAAFAAELHSLGPVRLHGDAHVEQYAVTDRGYGLDDFDDTAEGPSVIDLVRFLGSLRLTARERGWSSQFDHLADAFLRGYQHGLKKPEDDLKVPRVVRRLRARPARDHAAFLAWADGLMKPVTPQIARATHHALDLLAAEMRTGDRGRSADYFRIKRVGRIALGLGSRRMPKLLIRVEGPTAAPRDDVILEAKEPANLSGVECLAPPKQSAAVRIIAGTQQIGRLRHDLLSLVPSLIGDRGSLHHWWIHDWTPSYVEVNIHDLRSVTELSELARDAGFQLGSASLPVGNDAAVERRRREAHVIAALEPRVKRVSVLLTDDLLRAWDAFRRKSSAPAERRN
jgi:hypothetical protein